MNPTAVLPRKRDNSINPNDSSLPHTKQFEPDGVRRKGSTWSVVIVAYGGEALVRDCLRSVINFTDATHLPEIVVVDNSPDQAVLRALRHEFADEGSAIRFVANENLGFGQGNNVGAELTDSNYILFLNPDTELTEPVFEFATQIFSQNAQIGCFGVQLVGRDGSDRMSFNWIDRPGIVASVLIRTANRLGLFMPGRMFTSGADIFIRRNVFEKVGRFDERLFMYCEEADLSRRIVLSGYRTAFFAERRIVHLEAGGSGESVQKLLWRLDSKRKYCQKYGIDYRNYVVTELRRERRKALQRRLQRRRVETDHALRLSALQNELRFIANEKAGAP